MMAVSGRLWGTNDSENIHEIDPVTRQAIHTYYVGGTVFVGRFQGIAYHDGKIACADFLQNMLAIWEVTMP